MKIKYFLWILLPLLASCSNDEKYVNVPLEFKIPSNFPALVYNIEVNPPTQSGFELGKKIFYDGRLSSEGTISCGFCHIQQNAFTHHGHTVSHGVNNMAGTRNSPPIQNLAYQTQFMWDGAADNLDFQPVIPLLSAIEMNGNLTTIMAMFKQMPPIQNCLKKLLQMVKLILKTCSKHFLSLWSWLHLPILDLISIEEMKLVVL